MKLLLLILTSLCRATAANDDVHVVISGSASHALGVVACAASVFATTKAPERVVVHVVVAESEADVFAEALACALGSKRWRVLPFDERGPLAQRIGRLVSVRNAREHRCVSHGDRRGKI